MVKSELSNHYHNNNKSPMMMAKPHRNKSSSLFLSDGCLFLGGAFSALILVWGFSSFTTTIPNDTPNFESLSKNDAASHHIAPDFNFDPPDRTFYDDPQMGYTMDKKVRNWDEKREEWLKLHPSFAAGARERVFMVTGSQPKPCRNPTGDHLLLRFFKNKVDYCRLHGCDIFYNNALLEPKMFAYWAKYPAVRAAMVAHPEAEWIWWVDSDALFTDMEFKLPLERYREHNLVVHGWAHLIHEKRSWTGLNAGTLRSTFKDKFFPESDDQTGLAYLIAMEKDKWAERIYLESEYYFEGYWEEIQGTFKNITEKYKEMEKGVQRLRRRHAEKVSETYGEMREEYLKDAGNAKGSWRRPFITHFTGCQPCSGKYNAMYSPHDCSNAMHNALNFADNQVMRKFGYSLLDNAVSPLPFDYPRH
ncbi:Galactomannan galactosyltransferase 1 [Glycine soja]|nr:Galactomannan galactosyltransferase 1 [Glycine soja]